MGLKIKNKSVILLVSLVIIIFSAGNVLGYEMHAECYDNICMGKQGQSCDEVCSDYGKECNQNFEGLLNQDNCSVFRNFGSCECYAAARWANDQPGYDVVRGRCLGSTGTYIPKCSGKHKDVTRLCDCSGGMEAKCIDNTCLGKQGQSCDEVCDEQDRVCDSSFGGLSGPLLKQDNCDLFKQFGDCACGSGVRWADDQPSYVSGKNDANYGKCLGVSGDALEGHTFPSCSYKVSSVMRLCKCSVGMTPKCIGNICLGKQGQSCEEVCGGYGKECDNTSEGLLEQTNCDKFKLFGDCICDETPRWASDQPGYVSGRTDKQYHKCLGTTGNAQSPKPTCGYKVSSVMRLCTCTGGTVIPKGGTAIPKSPPTFVGAIKGGWCTDPETVDSIITTLKWVDGEPSVPGAVVYSYAWFSEVVDSSHPEFGSHCHQKGYEKAEWDEHIDYKDINEFTTPPLTPGEIYVLYVCSVEDNLIDWNNAGRQCAKLFFRYQPSTYAPSISYAWKDEDSDSNIGTNEYKKLSKIVSRDGYGNVLQTEDAKGNSEYTRYDNTVHAFPVRGWNDLPWSDETNPAWEMDYNNKWLVEKIYDANRKETRITYDEYDRPEKVIKPKDSLDKPTITYSYKFWEPDPKNPGQIEPNKVVSEQKLEEGKSTENHDFFDGLGRPYQSNMKVDGDKQILSINKFNNRGLLEKTYKPAELENKYFINLGGLFKIGKTFDSSDFMNDEERDKFSLDKGEERAYLKKEYHPDPLARLSKVVSYDTNSFTEINYSGENSEKVVITKDANNHYTKAAYDGFDNLIRLEDYSDDGVNFMYTTLYTYDMLNRLLTITDARNHITTNVYNTLGQLISTTAPDTGTTTFKYDENGNLKEKTDSKGQTIKYEYDALNRLTNVDYLNTKDTIKVYDDCSAYNSNLQNTKGSLCYVEDSSGKTYFSYDENGNVKWEIKHVQNTGFNIDRAFITEYDLDSAGNVVKQKITALGNNTVLNDLDYVYNNLNQLEKVYLNGEEIVSYTYTDTGAIEKQIYKRNTNVLSTVDYTYNINEWLETLNAQKQDATPLFQRTYNYDLVGNIIDKYNNISYLSLGESPSNPLAHFDYDFLNRLTNVQDFNYYNENIAFTYDATGNRLTRNTASYSYDNKNNQMVSDSNCSYEYDANGNTKTKTCNGIITKYEYDEENRLIKVDLENDGVYDNEYVYDANGLRTIKKDSAGTTTYIYDMNGNNVYEETIGGCTDSDGGEDYFVKGIAKMSDRTAPITEKDYDYCFDDYAGQFLEEGKYLWESYCDLENGDVDREQYECPNGCKDGACI